ncbi:MAG TPA: efflux RND transporter permease subunit [Gammaproteobacteria bacterium]|nr:efflux RND transporter permease subunit [Gammaproteobacteria bacterium]
MQQRFRRSGLAAWSIRRPIAVTMLALTVVVLGMVALERLGVDLLPRLIYPGIGIRVNDPGVPAKIMEERVTRQLEEQLAITEDAIAVESSTEEGVTRVNLTFPYGTDINIALRDASSRLDRAKRFLPTTIEPPVIYKKDPSQIPILEFVVSSPQRDAVTLRDWVDYDFSRWFLNLQGVAAAEVGGAPKREIQILVDQDRLAARGLTIDDVASAVSSENVDLPGGRITVAGRELASRTAGRFTSIEEIANLPLFVEPRARNETPVYIRDVATVIDRHEDVRLRIRLNGVTGVKLSIQKQPQANTVDVVDRVFARLALLRERGLIPADVTITATDDQSRYIRHAIGNASLAAITGAILAMVVVYLFLGNIRRTLIIGLAIPLAVLVTFAIMGVGDLTLNIMTLGGLALGIGMLVDSTIVMMENITRHQQLGEGITEAPVNAAGEVTSAIVASTATNLAAVVPFLFIGGLQGLLFSELIYTISAAILASLLVAITLVPSYSAMIHDNGISPLRQKIDALVDALSLRYQKLLDYLLQRRKWLPLAILLPLLVLAVVLFANSRAAFMPNMDDGRLYFKATGDPGIQVDDMDRQIRILEKVLAEQPEVESVFTMSGGFVFGRSEYFDSNYGAMRVQLVPADERDISSDAWRKKMEKKLRALNLAGIIIRGSVRHLRGIRFSRGDNDLSLRVQGPNLATLTKIGDELVARLQSVPLLSNLEHSYENNREELVVRIDRPRAADLGVSVQQIGKAVRAALDGVIVSEYQEGDRDYNVRLRLKRSQMRAPEDLENLLISHHEGRPVRLHEVARLVMEPSPSQIKRDGQRRIVEISGSFDAEASLDEIKDAIDVALADYILPEGYTLYDASGFKELQQGEAASLVVMLLALFLVSVVMAVQYESLRNPVIILLGVPFAFIGVAVGIYVAGLPITMPVWLGLIMLAGIVVNNAIVLVEQISIEREQGQDVDGAIRTAARLRLRPILMTTLTTVFGMLPLALALGEGSELLQPLAVVIVWGLSFSMLVSLFLIPTLYRLFHARTART